MKGNLTMDQDNLKMSLREMISASITSTLLYGTIIMILLVIFNATGVSKYIKLTPENAINLTIGWGFGFFRALSHYRERIIDSRNSE